MGEKIPAMPKDFKGMILWFMMFHTKQFFVCLVGILAVVFVIAALKFSMSVVRDSTGKLKVDKMQLRLEPIRPDFKK